MAQMMLARAAGPRHMVKVMGYAAAPVILGPLLGPVLAGAILQHSSWRWLFYINVPVGVLAVGLSIFFLPKDEMEIIARRLDFVGFLLLSPGLVAFLYGFDHLKDPASPYILGVAVVLIGLFLVRARKKGAQALMNLSLFQGKTFAAAATTQFLANGVSPCFPGSGAALPHRGLSRSPQKTGFLLAPLAIGMMCSYPLVGGFANRFGIRKVSAGGALLRLCHRAVRIHGTLWSFYVPPVGDAVCSRHRSGSDWYSLPLRGLFISPEKGPAHGHHYAEYPAKTWRPHHDDCGNDGDRLEGSQWSAILSFSFERGVYLSHGASKFARLVRVPAANAN